MSEGKGTKIWGVRGWYTRIGEPFSLSLCFWILPRLGIRWFLERAVIYYFFCSRITIILRHVAWGCGAEVQDGPWMGG
jgi:hypothetical protein